MKIEEILATIRNLSFSQGFYGRLYRRLMDIRQYDPESWAEIVGTLEAQKFSDSVDLVMYLEG